MFSAFVANVSSVLSLQQIYGRLVRKDSISCRIDVLAGGCACLVPFCLSCDSLKELLLKESLMQQLLFPVRPQSCSVVLSELGNVSRAGKQQPR